MNVGVIAQPCYVFKIRRKWRGCGRRILWLPAAWEEERGRRDFEKEGAVWRENNINVEDVINIFPGLLLYNCING